MLCLLREVPVSAVVHWVRITMCPVFLYCISCLGGKKGLTAWWAVNWLIIKQIILFFIPVQTT